MSAFVTETTLDEWRSVIRGERAQPDPSFLVIAFPNDEVRAEYLRRAKEWEDAEVRAVLRAMVGESRDSPEMAQIELLRLVAEHKARQVGVLSARPEGWPVFTEPQRRLLRRVRDKKSPPIWEGMTWIIDLLPQAPNQAISVLSSYLFVYAQDLPDLRIIGLSDAQSLMQARFVEVGDDEESRARLLRERPAQDLEFFTAAVWRAQGYEVTVTPAAKDGGKDVIATRRGANAECVYIECTRTQADVDRVNCLRGRIWDPNEATRGVLVALGGFTSRERGSATQVAEGDKRITLVDARQLIIDANGYLGHDWPSRLALILSSELRRFGTQRG